MDSLNSQTLAGQIAKSTQIEARRKRLILDGETRDLARQLYAVSFMPNNYLCNSQFTDQQRIERCYEAAHLFLRRGNAAEDKY